MWSCRDQVLVLAPVAKAQGSQDDAELALVLVVTALGERLATDCDHWTYHRRECGRCCHHQVQESDLVEQVL